MRHIAVRRAGLAGLALLLLPASAFPAAFALFEQGARGMGFAGAFTAQASDPSAIFHNPAGLAFLSGDRIYVGGTMVRPAFDFTGADPFPGEGVLEESDIGSVFPPAAYYSHSFSDRAAIGVGFNVPFGLKTEWASPDTFSGRFISQLADLKGFSVNPTLAVKLADRFAVGAGVDIRLSSVTIERRAPFFNPFQPGQVLDAAAVRLESDTATGVGFNVGMLAKPSDSISVGASYRHGVTIEYDGSAAFTPLPTGNAQLDQLLAARLPRGEQVAATAIDFPAFASVGVAWSQGDWTIEGDVNWYGWSSFEQLVLEFENEAIEDEVIEEEYEDTFQFRIGLERSFGDWALRGGYFFDQTPSPAASVSPLLPDADRHGFAIGASWISGNFRIDGASWIIRSPERSTEGVNRDNYNGIYKSSAVTLGLSLGYMF